MSRLDPRQVERRAPGTRASAARGRAPAGAGSWRAGRGPADFSFRRAPKPMSSVAPWTQPVSARPRHPHRVAVHMVVPADRGPLFAEGRPTEFPSQMTSVSSRSPAVRGRGSGRRLPGRSRGKSCTSESSRSAPLPPWWSQSVWYSCTKRTPRSTSRRARRQFVANEGLPGSAPVEPHRLRRFLPEGRSTPEPL